MVNTIMRKSNGMAEAMSLIQGSFERLLIVQQVEQAATWQGCRRDSQIPVK